MVPVGRPLRHRVVGAAAWMSETADIASDAIVGDGSSIWHLAQVREGAVIGRECTVGRGAYIGSDVRIGDRCKVQNYALVYEPAVLGDGVFVGPGVILTNDLYPRAVNPDGRRKQGEDWERAAVNLQEGASVGARAVCVAPVTIGRWAMIAAGAVVTADVLDFALVAGVPARWLGWVGRAGEPLQEDGPGRWRCPRTDATYQEVGPMLVEANPLAG